MVAANATRSSDHWPWLMLPARLVLFALFQALFALALGSWDASIAWWPLSATLTNLVTIALLIRLFRREGRSFRELFRIDRSRLAGDLLAFLGVVVVTAPLAYLPNVWLASRLFGSPEAALEVFLRPLPLWAAIAAVSFPLTIVFAELPAYFGYAMPRIEAQTRNPWLALGLSAFFLAAQHVTLPLVFDWRFMLWRLLMFVPFALFVGAVLRWRPSLLPYLVALHGLLDLSIVLMLFQRLGN